MNMKIVGISITAVVSLIVLAGVLMPVLDDARDNEKTVFNNNYNRYSQLLEKDLDSFTMEVTWDVTSTTASVTINGGEPYSYSMSSSRAPLIVSEGGTFEANKANSRGLLKYSESSAVITVTNGPVTIEVANGTAKLTDSASTPNEYTWTVGSWLFYPDNNGNYTAMNTTTDNDTEIYLNSINDLYFATIIATDSLGFVSGHGATCKFYNVADTPTYSMSIVSSELDGYNDVITTTIGSYAISTEAGTNTDDSPFVPFITMVPRAVEGHTNQNDAINALYSAIPVMIIISILLAVVALVARSRME